MGLQVPATPMAVKLSSDSPIYHAARVVCSFSDHTEASASKHSFHLISSNMTSRCMPKMAEI